MLQGKPDFFCKDPHRAVICVSSIVLTGLRLDVNFLRLQCSPHLQSRGNTRGIKCSQLSRKRLTLQTEDRKVGPRWDDNQGKAVYGTRYFITCSDGKR